MKTFFTILLVFSFFMSISAQTYEKENNTITYRFMVNDGPTLVDVGGGTITEGEEFSLGTYSFTNPFTQSTYDAITGATFSLDENSIKEDIELNITIDGLNSEGPGFHPILGRMLFLYFEAAVIGDSSGPHPSNQDYYLNSGTFATLKVPITQTFNDYLTDLGFQSSDDLIFAYFSSVLSTISDMGISTSRIEGQNGEPDILEAKFVHFSRFAGGGGRSFLTTDVKKDDNPIFSKEFRLNQNYPNPFNPATTISYNLPKEGFVSIKVYNAIGSEVSTLISGTKKAGTHEVVFNAGSLPSGVYFYTIRFDNTTQTKRMILIK